MIDLWEDRPAFTLVGDFLKPALVAVALTLAACGNYVDVLAYEKLTLSLVAIDPMAGTEAAVAGFELQIWDPEGAYFSIEGAAAQATATGCASAILIDHWSRGSGSATEYNGNPVYFASDYTTNYLGLSSATGNFRFYLLSDNQDSWYPELEAMMGPFPGIWDSDGDTGRILESGGFRSVLIDADDAGERRIATVSAANAVGVLTYSNTSRRFRERTYDFNGIKILDAVIEAPPDFILSGSSSLSSPAGYALEFAGLDAANGRSVFRGCFLELLDPDAAFSTITATFVGEPRFQHILKLYDDGSFLTWRNGSLYRYDSDGGLLNERILDLSTRVLIQQLPDGGTLLAENTSLTAFPLIVDGFPFTPVSDHSTRIIVLDQDLAIVMDHEFEGGPLLGIFYDGALVYLLVGEGTVYNLRCQGRGAY